MSSDYSTKYCIIGAGASGITAAKNFQQAGILCDVIEREDEVGGNWYFGKPNSSVYQTTHLLSSKSMTAYTDFPMPDDYPDYPNHAQVLAYLRRYARHFGIYDLITFHTAIESLERAEDGYWLVSLSNGETRRYKGVVIANGHHWNPQYPNFAGQFNGEVLHSADYKTPDVLRGKRVLVVGGGNSGCDIAVDAALLATKTFHSTRRGYHYLPKYILGIPTDQFAEMFLRLRLPRFMLHPSFAFFVRLAIGTPQQYGLPKPKHKIVESHPTIGAQLLHYIGHGDIAIKPNVKELQGDKVLFEDGSLEAIDLIVYATGFKTTFPFINDPYLNEKPRLYLHIFHPQYDNLFVAGLIQPNSGQFWIVDYQCQLMARFILAQDKNPSKADWFRTLKAGSQPKLRFGHTIETDRHHLEIDHFLYKLVLRKLMRQL